MGVSASDYRTSEFTLKDQDAVNHIQHLVELLKDEENHYGGYYFDDHYIDMYETGDDLTFKIRTGGYADSSPELRRSAVYEDEDDYGDPVDLFSEIQSNLKEGTYFTSMCCENDKSGMYFYMYLHHADGRNEYMSSNDVKNELLKKMGLK
jgi:hypothetical protein